MKLDVEKNHEFIIDIDSFESLSRAVGYLNCEANKKNAKESVIKKYQELRKKQVKMQIELIKKYGK